MSAVEFDVRIVLRSPFLFQGFDPVASDIDASALRNRDGLPIIPGDHLRGHLRHALSGLMGGRNSAEMTELFGAESLTEPDIEAAQDMPIRGVIVVGDLTATGQLEASGATRPLQVRYNALATRVQIDDATGAADTGSLQMIELVAAPGSEIVFEGTIRLLKASLADAFADRFKQALLLIPALGAIKTSGFGELLAEKCAINRRATTKSAARPQSANRLAFEVAFDGSLLVNAHRESHNIFVGSAIVPGGALKGALADRLERETGESPAGRNSKLGPALSQLRISHAFPLDIDTGLLADRAIPDCLVAAKMGTGIQLADASWAGEWDALLESADAAPAFTVDWKSPEEHLARRHLGRPASGLEEQVIIRGRVGVNENGVAEDGKLFVTAPIETIGRRWRFVVDSSDIADRDAADRIVETLAAGLDRVGKTDAKLTVLSIAEAKDPPLAANPWFRLLLETPAVLTQANDALPPQLQYERYFRHVLDDTDLVVDTAFAYRGYVGRYQATRFRAFGARNYLPFEVTKPGAVFGFRSDRPDFAARIASLAAKGLSPVVWSGGAPVELDWRACPFVSQNGYGEVTVAADRSMAADRKGTGL